MLILIFYILLTYTINYSFLIPGTGACRWIFVRRIRTTIAAGKHYWSIITIQHLLHSTAVRLYFSTCILLTDAAAITVTTTMYCCSMTLINLYYPN